ncbi:MAG: aspartyl/glutamyl-tRNA amidotransferase subunit C, partial [Mesorhizobium sp.]
MSVDLQTVKRVARLARIAVSEEDAERMTGELN